LKITTLITLVSFLSSGLPVYAKVTPCTKVVDGRWKFLVGTKCVQWTLDDLKENNKRLTTLKFYKEVHEPESKKIKKNYEKLQQSYELSRESWKKQESLYKQLNKNSLAQSEVWKESFFKLKNKKVPPPHWTKSPVFWFFVGVGLTAAVTATTILLVNLNRPN
jgi:hypothetical protein